MSTAKDRGALPREMGHKDLEGFNGKEIDAERSNFRFSGLSGADFRGAFMPRSDLVQTNLMDADLTGAVLDGCDMTKCFAEDARFMSAALRGADLTQAAMAGAVIFAADFTGARLAGTDFGGLVVVARVGLSTGHEMFLWTSVLGGCVVAVGHNCWVGENAIEQACDCFAAKLRYSEDVAVAHYLRTSLQLFRVDKEVQRIKQN